MIGIVIVACTALWSISHTEYAPLSITTTVLPENKKMYNRDHHPIIFGNSRTEAILVNTQYTFLVFPKDDVKHYCCLGEYTKPQKGFTENITKVISSCLKKPPK